MRWDACDFPTNCIKSVLEAHWHDAACPGPSVAHGAGCGSSRWVSEASGSEPGVVRWGRRLSEALTATAMTIQCSSRIGVCPAGFVVRDRVGWKTIPWSVRPIGNCSAVVVTVLGSLPLGFRSDDVYRANSD
jgi:hypothetical protein